MKILLANIKTLSLLSFLGLALGLFQGCGDDEPEIDNSVFGEADYSSLQTLIQEVDDYLSTAEEGINAGNHPPGSLGDFEVIVSSVKEVIIKGMNQKIADRAVETLKNSFEEFKANIVAPANPWIQQVNGNFVTISDNAGDGKPGTEGGITQAVKGVFTVEAKFWVVNIQQAGFSNVLFGTQQGGADDGFVVRYFSDGHLDVSIGTPGPHPDGPWVEASTSAGVMTAGEWIHVSFVNAGTAHKLYVDGTEVLSLDAEYAPSVDIPFTIGNSYSWNDRAMNGLIKDFRLWTEARSKEQITNNLDTELKGNEDNLEVFFPFDANLGKSFVDVTGKYVANFRELVIWVKDGDLGAVEIDFSELDQQVTAAGKIVDEGTEGDKDGDYPVGTKSLLNDLIAEANDLKTGGTNSQPDVNDLANKISNLLTLIEENKVRDANGILVDAQDDEAKGLSVTPVYSPPGSFTVEFEVKIESLQSACCGQGNLFGNGSYGLLYSAYDSPDSSDQVLEAGKLYFFIRNGGAYDGARSESRVLKPGNWQHIALTYDVATKTSRIFVGGEEEVSFEGREIPDPVDWSEMWIGNTWVKSDARIKNFRFWDEVRDKNDLNASITGEEPHLQMYFPLDRVKGIIFKDETEKYNAELEGIVWD